MVNVVIHQSYGIYIQICFFVWSQIRLRLSFIFRRSVIYLLKRTVLPLGQLPQKETNILVFQSHPSPVVFAVKFRGGYQFHKYLYIYTCIPWCTLKRLYQPKCTIFKLTDLWPFIHGLSNYHKWQICLKKKSTTSGTYMILKMGIRSTFLSRPSRAEYNNTQETKYFVSCCVSDIFQYCWRG